MRPAGTALAIPPLELRPSSRDTGGLVAATGAAEWPIPLPRAVAVPSDDVRLLILDVDGVLTDGIILIDDDGRQSKGFHIQDGLAITLWKAVDRQVAILTSKRSPAVEARARMLGIDLLEQGAEDKLPGLERLLAAAGVPVAQTAYVGDDLLDLPVLRRVGYPIAVADAAPEARELARYVTRRPGGRGAVRDAVEHLLKRQNQWSAALKAIGADR